jgi:hypothetical protein
LLTNDKFLEETTSAVQISGQLVVDFFYTVEFLSVSLLLYSTVAYASFSSFTKLFTTTPSNLFTFNPHIQTRPQTAAIMSEITNEKAEANTNVLTITRSLPARQASNQSINVMSTIEDIDSTHSMTPPATAHNEKFPDTTSSPYYHPPTQASESKQNINAVHSSFDQDLEAQTLTQQKTEAGQSKTNLLKKKCTTNVDPAWPGRDQLKMRKKQLKREKACCGWWAGMSSKKRTTIKVLIFLIIVAMATGLGIGISRALNTGVWTKSGANTPIS